LTLAIRRATLFLSLRQEDTMGAVNVKRVVWGGLVAGVVWFAWAAFVNFVLLMPRYMATQAAGLMYEKPRYAVFPLVWMAQFLVFGVLIAALYAGVRATWGAGLLTALKVGLIFGLAAGFSVNFYVSAWVPFTRYIPAGWVLELFGGAILAALIAGWLYKDSPAPSA
jgi:hypothetical protein